MRHNTHKGKPILGCHIDAAGANFGIYAKDKKKVTLVIYTENSKTTIRDEYILNDIDNQTDNVWHIFVEGISTNASYTWIIDDSQELLDPYAYLYDENMTKAICISKGMPVENIGNNIQSPIIYETSIKLFTSHPSSGVKQAGTYAGLIKMLPYLRELGVNIIELLPIFEWDDVVWENGKRSKILRNVWGYNPVGFFAPSHKLVSTGCNPLVEFRKLIEECHKRGIAVILDVVYNHTAEGDERGSTYNLKKMSNDEFYLMDSKKPHKYLNISGCGNTLNANTKPCEQMIIDSLHYWHDEMGVDGFRFDLCSALGRGNDAKWLEKSILDKIAADKVLSQAILISESWDCFGSFMGHMPDRWAEWNGAFRDTVRQFVRGDNGQVVRIVDAIFRGSNIFGNTGKKPQNSINFVTSHDGFTMYDLVSYNEKHNLANGENNRDGDNNNHSYNWGVEGETEDCKIREARLQTIRNMIFILMISRGIPMIRMGDECGHTQKGNNNAYCQDNEIAWLDWDRAKKFGDITRFVQEMISLRKKYKVLDSNTFDMDNVTLHGVEAYKPDLGYYSRTIAFSVIDEDTNTELYIGLSGYSEDLEFELPERDNATQWQLIIDTKVEKLQINEKIKDTYTLSAYSCIMLARKLENK